MKVSDLLLIGLAAVGIYYVGKRFMNDANKKTSSASTPSAKSNDVIAQAPPKVVTTIGTPSINGDLDIIKWVENE